MHRSSDDFVKKDILELIRKYAPAGTAIREINYFKKHNRVSPVIHKRFIDSFSVV